MIDIINNNGKIEQNKTEQNRKNGTRWNRTNPKERRMKQLTKITLKSLNMGLMEYRNPQIDMI